MSIHWVNEAASFNDSDGFGAVFGSQAVTARLVVEAAIQGWAGAIENFNYADGTNDFKLTVNMGSDKNTGASAAFASKVDANHKPMAGTITLGAGTDGHGAGYFLDPTPFESSEFQGTVINAYAANATAGGPADRLTDLFTIMTLELTHEMGILDDPTSSGSATPTTICRTPIKPTPPNRASCGRTRGRTSSPCSPRTTPARTPATATRCTPRSPRRERGHRQQPHLLRVP